MKGKSCKVASIEFHLFIVRDTGITLFTKSKLEDGLIRKPRQASKSKTLQTRLKSFSINIMPDISRSKGNQTIKIGQLIGNNMKNFFLEKVIDKMCLIK